MDREQTLNRAKKYSSAKYSLSIIETIYSLVLLFAFLASGASEALAGGIQKMSLNNYIGLSIYILAVGILYFFLNLPLNFYSSYTLEHRFALSKQKIPDWIKDQIKAGLISYIIAIILLVSLYWIIKRYPGIWWFIISLLWIFFSLALAKITPIVIIPLFFKYKKLKDEALRERILKLAEKMNINILDCFEIDFSKKTLKANAAFVGIGKTKRVLLSDTLKDAYTHDEIEVILAHEFAHYKLKHLIKLVLINSIATMVIFYSLFMTSGYFLHIFGFRSLLDIAALPVIFIYFLIFGILMQPFQNYLSRRLEIDADKAALLSTSLKDAFVSMMNKLANQNLADRNPHPIIKFFFFDHPPIDERIDMAQKL